MNDKKELTVNDLNILKLSCERDILNNIQNSIDEFKKFTGKQIKKIEVIFIEDSTIGKGKEYHLVGIKIDVGVFG